MSLDVRSSSRPLSLSLNASFDSPFDDPPLRGREYRGVLHCAVQKLRPTALHAPSAFPHRGRTVCGCARSVRSAGLFLVYTGARGGTWNEACAAGQLGVVAYAKAVVVSCLLGS